MIERTFPVLESSRLILRRIVPSDVGAVYHIYSDPAVARYDMFLPISTMKEAKNIITNYSKEFESGRGIRWGIAARADNRIIGTCGFMDFNWESKRCEIGFGLSTEECGKGIMTEALKTCMGYGFAELGLNRIEASIDKENRASLYLMKKLNFLQEGVLRQREYFKEKFHDVIIMSLLRSEYI